MDMSGRRDDDGQARDNLKRKWARNKSATTICEALSLASRESRFNPVRFFCDTMQSDVI